MSAIHESQEVARVPIIKTVPWKRQNRAFWFMRGKEGVMLDCDMGGGKSKVVVDLMVNEEWKLVLIACPKCVVSNWRDEFAKHAGVHVKVMTLGEGHNYQRSKDLIEGIQLAKALKVPLAVVINYDAVHARQLGMMVAQQRWDAIVCDESHRIKAPGGVISKFFAKLKQRTNRRICLTGTPMRQGPMDLYAQYRFLDDRVFGTSYTVFKSVYACEEPIRGTRASKIIGYKNMEDFWKRYQSIAYSSVMVKEEEDQNLPPVVDMIREFELPPDVFKMYYTFKRQFVVALASSPTVMSASNVLTRILRLQQMTSGYIQPDRDVETGVQKSAVVVSQRRMEVLKDILEGLKDEEPVVVFCKFRLDLKSVHKACSDIGRKSLELSGTINQLDEWQRGGSPVLAVQLHAGSEGISLTRARYCVYYSIDHSLGNYLQTRKRIYRPGQTSSCTMIHVVARNTIDETIYEALKERRDVIEAVRDMRYDKDMNEDPLYTERKTR